jgi:subtilisin-like proprotein convertase family protein
MTHVRTRTDKGWTLTAGALAAVAMSAMAVTFGGPIAQQAEAAAPAVPTGCTAAASTIVNGAPAAGQNVLAPTANADDGNPLTPLTYSAGPTRTSIITVAGAGKYLRDVDLRTSITHFASKDVTIRLTAPNGKSIVINSGNEKDTYDATTNPTGYYRNGGPNNDVWNGTRWDDQGGVPVNDFAFTPLNEGTPLSLIEPEGSLGTFIGIDPNGQWKLEVTNAKPNYATSAAINPPPVTGPLFVEDPDTGNFASWGLDLSTLTAAPATTTTTVTNTTAAAIPDGQANGPGITREFVVSAAAGNTVQDLDLVTKMPHADSGDLDVTLTSPAGTQVTIVTDAGRGLDKFSNNFNPTRWDDGAAEGVTDFALPLNGNVATLQPEEALAAFNGENPNGTWKLNVVDDASPDTGTFESATLDIKSYGCGVVTPPVVVPPVVVPPVNTPPRPGTTPTPPGTTQSITLGLTGKAKRSVRFGTKAASVKLSLNRAATITAVLKRGKKTLKTVVKQGLAGSNTVSVKLPKKAGKYSLKVTASATGVTSISKTITLTIKAKPKA